MLEEKLAKGTQRLCLTAELKKKAGLTGLIASDGRKETSDSKRQFFLQR